MCLDVLKLPRDAPFVGTGKEDPSQCLSLWIVKKFPKMGLSQKKRKEKKSTSFPVPILINYNIVIIIIIIIISVDWNLT